MKTPPPQADALERVLAIPGVTGFTLTDGMGEVLHSSIEDAGLNEFIAFLSGMLPSIAETAGVGPIRQAIFKGPQTDSLLLLAEGEQSLGLTVKPRASMPDVSQQVEGLLHWD